MIAVVDSGVANLASVMAALQRIGAHAEVTSDAARIRRAKNVILPGVGAAAPAMAQLRNKELIEVIRSLKQPVLGICLGMQLLFADSDEGHGPATKCLDIIPGSIRSLPASPDTPVPHMGWNRIDRLVKDHPLLRGVEDGSYVYFVHSFAAPVAAYTVTSTDYGERFTSICGLRNFYGCQFHPERSGAVGSQILKNFVEM